MIVYKFGGASVKSSNGVKNIVKIISSIEENIFIVVSAMGKTTNNLEIVLDYFMKAEHDEALNKLESVIAYHKEIIDELDLATDKVEANITPVFNELKQVVSEGIGDDFDKWYDRIVSYGEVLSSIIISLFMQEKAIDNQWLDMRKNLVTDSNFREANINYMESERRLKAHVDFSKSKIYIGQGFIGTNMKGQATTLGREGSDFSAAVIGNILDAEKVVIWKDVPGILNADPRIFPNTILIPELSYLDAVELAYSGAQIIHPKTIKPLENKQIPLYVKPFGTPEEAGSVIYNTNKRLDVPILILKKNQVLITLRPMDFSFILEESLTWIFTVIEKHRLKVSLIQSSAVSISICVDNSRYLNRAIDELSNDYKVGYNTNLELLTIRGINRSIVEENTKNREILLKQRTRRSGRYLMKSI